MVSRIQIHLCAKRPSFSIHHLAQPRGVLRKGPL
jgi:hypothetical protein